MDFPNNWLLSAGGVSLPFILLYRTPRAWRSRSVRPSSGFPTVGSQTR